MPRMADTCANKASACCSAAYPQAIASRPDQLSPTFITECRIEQGTITVLLFKIRKPKHNIHVEITQFFFQDRVFFV